MTPDLIPLVELNRRLLAFCGLNISYTILHKKVLDGALPATRAGGRWFVATEDLPLIARRCGAENVAA